jgi:hypothetical protein
MKLLNECSVPDPEIFLGLLDLDPDPFIIQQK